MYATPELFHTLRTLNLLLPAKGVVHVGAGLLSAEPWFQQIDLPKQVRIDCIEGDLQRHQLLAKAASLRTGLHVHHAVLGGEAGQATFYSHSNPNESGVLPAQALSSIWPNNTALASHLVEQTTLDSFVQQHLPAPDAANWLYIDCLPAAAIAQGASAQLTHIDVLLARVIPQAQSDASPLKGQGTTQDELSACLLPYNFRLLTSYEERNPAFVTAIYVRDHRQERDALAKAVQSLQQTQAQLQAHSDELQSEKLELLKKLELQTQAHQALEADLNTQIKALQAEKAELLQKQEQQVQTQKVLEADLDKATKAKKTAQRLQAEMQSALDKAQAENQSAALRQKLLKDEFLKMQAQLEMVKEMFAQSQINKY